MNKRDKRYSDFKDRYLDIIAFNFDVSLIENTFSFIIEGTRSGTLQYFPKSNKLQFHDNNNWENDGFNNLKKILNIPDLC